MRPRVAVRQAPNLRSRCPGRARATCRSLATTRGHTRARHPRRRRGVPLGRTAGGPFWPRGTATRYRPVRMPAALAVARRFADPARGETRLRRLRDRWSRIAVSACSPRRRAGRQHGPRATPTPWNAGSRGENPSAARGRACRRRSRSRSPGRRVARRPPEARRSRGPWVTTYASGYLARYRPTREVRGRRTRVPLVSKAHDSHRHSDLARMRRFASGARRSRSRIRSDT